MGFVKKIGGALFGSKPKPAQPFRAPGFEQQGQLLNDLLSQQASQAFAQPLGIPQTPRLIGGVDPSQFTPQFEQADPFQFTPTGFDPSKTGDIIGAAFQQAQPFLQQQFERGSEDILELQNRLGTLTSGRTGEQLQDLAGQQQLALSNILGQAAQEQARQQLGAEQFGAQLEQQRQAQQAQELFRQQGATEGQALALANAALQQAQLGQGAQQQAFSQQMLQRQGAIDPLLRLFSLSSGATPGQPGSSGLLGGLVQAGATAAGSALGGPIGGAIGSGIGGLFNRGGKAA
jgi:hypothetical protein